MAIIKELNPEGDSKLARQLNFVKEIALESTKVVLEDEKVYMLGGTVGVIQGLKYTGSFVRGAKAGIAVMGVMVGANVVRNIVSNLDEIKEIE